VKTTIAAASFALITTLSGFSTAHAAGFNDRDTIPDVTSTQTARQDLSHLRVVHGFNQQSHHARVERNVARSPASERAAGGAHCDLTPRVGFNRSRSFASC
jgi:hypothetical protein